ncbi:DUF2059 domain-containing protein [Rhodobacter sp. Har01]|uniref:DUF2059 domain-containing protein n=1 Tax=Rhodobacter sp. Har01 TaxID=2883999 RepID=UPI001D0748FA|nr:DUF2059 domain-containing protein [Rhodobacter sp. Har01]MCB6177614.1 DUF2059 domain-containing protein [Rhodobacter sp. Har01]
MRHSIRLLALCALVLALPTQVGSETASPAPAEAAAAATDAAGLAALLQLDPTFAVLIDEAGPQAADLEAQFFPGRGGAEWTEAVLALYDPTALRVRFDTAFAEALQGQEATIPAAAAFFASELGQRILALEIDARRALIDVAVEEAAEVAAQNLRDRRDPRLRLIRDLIAAGDLVETGVAGTLTAQLAFSDGLAEGSPPGLVRPRQDRIQDIWSDEAAVRGETGAWLIRFMVQAYAPLSEEDLRAYVRFSETPEGRAVTAALSRAMEAALVPVSHDLGRLTARFASSRQI